MQTRIYLLLLLCISTTYLLAQNTTIKPDKACINCPTNEPNASAVLDIQSTDKGILIPRMNTTQRTGILNLTDGLLVYDTDTKSFWYYNDTQWTELTLNTDEQDLELSGNTLSLTNDPTTVDLSSFENNWTESSGDVYRSSGNVGIGILDPEEKLHIAGGIKVPDTVGTILYNSSTPTGVGTDGFRMKFDGSFFGGSGDALLFEKTDNGQSDPDGGMVFVNTGSDGMIDTSLVIRGSGNIGIGTPNPSEKLEVIGNAKATKFIGDGSMLTNLPSTSLWTENSGDVYRSSGNVGVGVIPTNNLSVRMNTEVLDVAQNDGTLSFLGDDLEWQSFTANRSGPLLGVILSFRASSTGISRVLTIYEGEGTGGTLLFTSDPISNTTNTRFNISGVDVTQGNKYTIAISNYRGWLFGSNTYAGGISSIGSIRDFRFQTYVYAQGAGFNVSDDAVGIGLPNPEEKLHIAGGIKIPDTVGTILYNSSTPTGVGTDGFRMRFDGNFFGTNFDALVFEKTDNGQSPPDSGASGFAFVSRGNNNIVDTALVIKSSGNIGIGAPNPGAKLQIIGGSNANSTTGGYLINGDLATFNLALDDNEIAARNNGDPSNLFLQSRGGNTLMNANGGDVGIGTTSPTQKLDVNGQARIRNLPTGSGSTVVADVNGNLFVSSSSPNVNEQRINDLQEENEILRAENAEIKARLAKIEALLSGKVEKMSNTTSALTSASLQQNAPNPFDESTTIQYFIPAQVKSASLQVMDQNGRIIKSIPIQDTGNGQITLQANLLSAGTYSYSLVLDGRVMGTKQMVLTH